MSVMRNSARALIGARSAASARLDDLVQVRMSALAILTASFGPAAVFALTAIPLQDGLFSAWAATDWPTYLLQLAVSCYLFLMTVLTTQLSAAIVVVVTHVLARGLQRTRELDYALIGAVVSIVAAPMIYLYLPTTMPAPTLVLTGALASAIYRQFAGVEALALRKAALAADPLRQFDIRPPARHVQTR